MTTLVTLHDLNLATAYCQRLYVLSQGQIVMEGTPEEALTPELLRQVFHVDAVVGKHPITGCLQLSLSPLLSETMFPIE